MTKRLGEFILLPLLLGAVGVREVDVSGLVVSQYRVCFVWTTTGPEQVEITDYH